MAFITGLTDTQLRATVVPVSLTSTTITGSVAVTGTFWQATQPVSGTITANAGTGTLAVSGPLTDTQLRLTAVPVSLASTTVTGSVAVTGTFWQATQPVSLAANTPTIAAGTALIGKVGIDQTTVGTTNAFSLAQIGANTVLTGNGVAGTGAQRVTIASDNTAFAVNATLQTGANVIGAVTQSGTWNVGSITTLPALATGANVIGALTANQSVNKAQINGVTPLMGNGVTGTGSQRVTIASDNTAFAVNATLTAETTKVIGTVNIAAAQTLAAVTSITNAVTVTPPTLTKATQGATGFSTQDLKDSGRAIVNAATAIAGVTCVTTEALLALNISRDGAAVASATTHAVTSGKRWRITGMVASSRSSAATVLSARVSLRMNPSGAATATSPIIAIASMTQQAAALAEAGDTCVLTFQDGIEVSGTMQVGLSQVCSGVGGVIYASLIGYEY